MKNKIIFFSLLTLLSFGDAICQQVDFKLLDAIKSSEITIERSFGSDLLDEVDVLPEGKKYLLIIA